MTTARGTFEISMTPAPPELGGAITRFDFTKVFAGDFVGTGAGVMLAHGDPAGGSAGYVAIEAVHGTLGGGAEGHFLLQQLGVMAGGEQTLHYLIVPGSGTDACAGISGRLDLVIDEDGTHHYVLDYRL